MKTKKLRLVNIHKTTLIHLLIILLIPLNFAQARDEKTYKDRVLIQTKFKASTKGYWPQKSKEKKGFSETLSCVHHNPCMKRAEQLYNTINGYNGIKVTNSRVFSNHTKQRDYITQYGGPMFNVGVIAEKNLYIKNCSASWEKTCFTETSILSKGQIKEKLKNTRNHSERLSKNLDNKLEAYKNLQAENMRAINELKKENEELKAQLHNIQQQLNSLVTR
ncbi:MAG: hypothetical protein KDD58_03295 [Bdellovibrionales bacterium]|nr:hypothetical protein [Bdellovibrionales bacterium]